MQNLPIELKKKIADNLSILDHLRLRLVNRKWKSVVDTFFSLKSLAVCDHKFTLHDFVFLDGLIDCFAIDSQTFSRISLNENQFAGVKNLVIHSTNCTHLLNKLKNLKKLENLEMNSISLYQPLTLIESESLKNFKLERCICHGSIEIRAPKLANLIFKILRLEWQILNFLTPSSIKYLKTIEYAKKIEEFINLEAIHCYYSFDLAGVNILDKLDKLKEIYLYNEDMHFLEHLIRRINLSSKKDPRKLFYRYVKIENEVELWNIYPIEIFTNSSSFLNRYSIEFLSNNLSKLPSRFNSDDTLDYFRSNNDALAEKIPDALVAKFSELSFLEIGKFDDLDSLLRLLNCCKKIKTIKIRNNLLPQKFFDQLPNLCSRLLNFSMYINEDSNLDFLLKFRSLDELELTNHPIDCHSIQKLFANVKLINLSCKVKRIDGFKRIKITYNDKILFKEYILHTTSDRLKYKSLVNLIDSFRYI